MSNKNYKREREFVIENSKKKKKKHHQIVLTQNSFF